MSFERFILQDLLAWKVRPNRAPLILRGARQVGKTTLVNFFGQHHFENMVAINLESSVNLKSAFEIFEPKKIINRIAAFTGQRIIPGKTLLFIDEIQEAPKAIQALRYFKENLPDLHVIAAGSLLEFVLNSDQFKMPVGRVEFLYLQPLSFAEFLKAQGDAILLETLQETALDNPLPPELHQKALALVREYIALGGMPGVLSQYLPQKDITLAHHWQQQLLATYRNDFGKYAKAANIHVLNTLFEKMPTLIAQEVKYAKVEPDMRGEKIKSGLELLQYAGLVYKTYATAASGVPLNALLNYKKFKLFFVDTGLIAGSAQLTAEILNDTELTLIHQGALTEQFVAQELIAHQPAYMAPQVMYWSRDKKNSTAEVDFVIQLGSKIIPIEVKSGKTGRLKSLQVFMQEKGSPLGVKISQAPLSLEKNILSVPLYMLARLTPLISSTLAILS